MSGRVRKSEVALILGFLGIIFTVPAVQTYNPTLLFG